MDLNEQINYLQTNTSFISVIPQIKENNFIPIINLYENKYKDIDQNQILTNQNNNFKIDYLKDNENNQNYTQHNQDDMQDIDDSVNEKSKLVEISDSGKIEIKNNQNLVNKNNKLEDSNNILDFDDKAENIIMNNNPYFINNSSNNINKNNKPINKKENFSDYILQDIPININDDNELNKWKKFSYLYKEKNKRLIKKTIFTILNRLISLKKNNGKNNKIEMIEINYNNKKLEKGRYDNSNEDINIRNNSYNTNKNSIYDNSTDSRASYDNISNIITTTQIKTLSNSSDFNNTINNISININNSKLIIPSQEKSNYLKEINLDNNYQKTDVSQLYPIGNILDSDQFKNVIDFLQYKDDLFIKKLNNTDSANVRLNLDSGVKRKEYGNIYTINEEDNESYDSLSIQKSLLNSAKVTPTKKDSKKNSINNLNEINNNVISNSNKDFLNKNKIIEEINIGSEEEDEKIINNNNIITDINTNKEKKIISIDLDMKNGYQKKEGSENEKKDEESEENKDIRNKDIETEDEKNNDEDKKNEEKEEKEEKDEKEEEENEDKDKENEDEINKDKEEKEDKEKNEDGENKDYENGENEEKKNEDNKMDISDNENNERDIVNYNTPESREKTIEKLYESIKGNKNNKKHTINEFEANDNNNNDNYQFSDFNNIINNEEEKDKNNQNNERIIIKSDENNENYGIFKSVNSNEEQDNLIVNKDKDKLDEKIIFSTSNLKFPIRDSFLSLHMKTQDSNIIENSNKNKDNKMIQKLDDEINTVSSVNRSKSTNNDNLKNEFLRYKIIDHKNLRILFCHNDNLINNNTYLIPIESYIYILQLCFKKNLPLTTKYHLYMQKLLKKLERNININIGNNNVNNQYYENRINEEISNFERALKYLKKCYIYLICKRSNLKNKAEKEKLMADFDISKKQEDVTKLFNNILLLINKYIDKNKYYLYIQIITNILKKYEKINKSEISEAKIKDKKNELAIPENDVLLNNNNLDLLKELKKKDNKKFFILSSLIIPLLYIYNYFNNNWKK